MQRNYFFVTMVLRHIILRNSFELKFSIINLYTAMIFADLIYYQVRLSETYQKQVLKKILTSFLQINLASFVLSSKTQMKDR